MSKLQPVSPELIEEFTQRLPRNMLHGFHQATATRWVRQGFRYPVEAKGPREPILEWCVEKYGAYSYKLWADIVCFQSEEHAVMFKLRWG